MVEGSGSGSIPLTSGSGSGRPKNMWILWIRIRNTDKKIVDNSSQWIECHAPVEYYKKLVFKMKISVKKTVTGSVPSTLIPNRNVTSNSLRSIKMDFFWNFTGFLCNIYRSGRQNLSISVNCNFFKTVIKTGQKERYKKWKNERERKTKKERKKKNACLPVRY